MILKSSEHNHSNQNPPDDRFDVIVSQSRLFACLRAIKFVPSARTERKECKASHHLAAPNHNRTGNIIALKTNEPFGAFVEEVLGIRQQFPPTLPVRVDAGRNAKLKANLRVQLYHTDRLRKPIKMCATATVSSLVPRGHSAGDDN